MKHQGYNDGVTSTNTALDYKYQGQELNESFEYNMHEFQLRHYDATIGRFVTTDPYEQFMSPYLAMGNNPVTSFDPDGGYCTDSNGNTIVCPDGEDFDFYRDNDKDSVSVQDEIDLDDNSSSTENYDSSQNSVLISPQVGDKIAPAMNERPNGFHRDFDELMLNLVGYSSFQQGNKIHHVDAYGRVVNAAPEHNGAGSLALIEGGGTSKITGWISKKIFRSLPPSLQAKFANAISRGIVSPKDSQGIIKLTATEINKLKNKGIKGYTHKLKIKGNGGDSRIYGKIGDNGHVLFDKIMGH